MVFFAGIPGARGVRRPLVRRLLLTPSDQDAPEALTSSPWLVNRCASTRRDRAVRLEANRGEWRLALLRRLDGAQFESLADQVGARRGRADAGGFLHVHTELHVGHHRAVPTGCVEQQLVPETRPHPDGVGEGDGRAPAATSSTPCSATAPPTNQPAPPPRSRLDEDDRDTPFEAWARSASRPRARCDAAPQGPETACLRPALPRCPRRRAAGGRAAAQAQARRGRGNGPSLGSVVRR